MEPIPEDDSLQPLSSTLTRESSLDRVRDSLDVSSRSPRDFSDIDSRQSAGSPLSSIMSGPSNPIIIVSGSPNPITPRPPSIDQAPSMSDETDRGTEELSRTPALMDSSPEKSRNTGSFLSPDYGTKPEGVAFNKLPKLILPDSEDTNNESDTRLLRSPGPRSRSWTSGDVPSTHQRTNSSSVLRLPPTPPELRRDALKDLESEENLRKEYERKAVYVSILLYVVLC